MQITHTRGDGDVDPTENGYRYCLSDRLSLDGFGADDTNR
jgi:hypothetical protein